MNPQSQRVTVKPVGKRSVGRPHCALCGHVQRTNEIICPNGCFWNLIGWTGYRGTDGVTVFTDHRALSLAKMHRWNPETRRRSAKSFPKIVAAAAILGWSGNNSSPSQPTFFDPEEF
jgi:hypothetical protein